MPEIVRKLGELTVTAAAYWAPIPWLMWDDYGSIPAGIPIDLWQAHRGHPAAYLQSGLGWHGLRCEDCDVTWEQST